MKPMSKGHSRGKKKFALHLVKLGKGSGMPRYSLAYLENKFLVENIRQFCLEEKAQLPLQSKHTEA